MPGRLLAGERDRCRATLLELIHADLEYRWKAGESTRVEEYLEDYPELAEEEELIELTEAERRLGRRFPNSSPAAGREAGNEASGSARLGKFELLEELGSGAFGSVYRVRDTVLDRIVAVKVSRSNWECQEELDRFLRETHNAAALRHPGIVTVHEAGQSEGRCYLVSELVRGPRLARRLAAGRPAFGESVEIVAQVAEAFTSPISGG